MLLMKFNVSTSCIWRDKAKTNVVGGTTHKLMDALILESGPQKDGYSADSMLLINADV